jgi:hypothetical protein
MVNTEQYYAKVHASSDSMEEALDTNKNKRNSSNHNHINKSPDDDAQSGTPGSDTISTDEKGKLILG